MEEDIEERLKRLEQKLEQLEETQKQDADEVIGMTADLLHRTTQLEEEIAEINQDLRAQQLLLEQEKNSSLSSSGS